MLRKSPNEKRGATSAATAEAHGKAQNDLGRTLRLSLDYYDSLTRFAVPLDERAIAALAHSALALDIYCWLAQRLHRIAPGAPQFVPWAALYEQFGEGYKEIRFFRRDFLKLLTKVRGADRDPDQAHPVGHGITEAAAVRDLLEQIEDEVPSFVGGETRALTLSPEAWRWPDGTVDGATAALIQAAR